MKRGTIIQHVSGNCWNSFQGHRSNVRVTVRPNALLCFLRQL